MKSRSTLVICLLMLIINQSTGQTIPASSRWVDSIYNTMTTEQRIAQLFLIRAYSCNDSLYNDSIDCIAQLYQPGGFCFFKGSPVRQANLVNRLQKSSSIPLLISIDAEWGLGMRLDSAPAWPRQMALGALQNDSLIYRMGKLIGRDSRRLGVQFNFAPVADVNNNPLNPVISFRSFGESPTLVAKKSVLYMKGMQDAGIMTTGKHFPGHGDTDNDSHYTLPVINHSRHRLDSVELAPFKELIRAGIKGIMVAHLYVPVLDTTPNTATTLSYPVITGLLKKELGFKGFIVTDALDMQGVTKYFKPGEIEVKALLAGNDILLLPKDVEMAVAGIKSAIDSGVIAPEMIETKCKKLLALKETLGLKSTHEVQTRNLIRDINSEEVNSLINEMVDGTMTLLGNQLRMVPVTNLDRRKIAIVSVGDSTRDEFFDVVSQYAPATWFNFPVNASDSLKDSLLMAISKYDLILAGIHGITSSPSVQYGITKPVMRFLDTLISVNRTILVLFGTPYALNVLNDPGRAEALLVAYQDNEVTRRSAAEALFGGFSISGKLPVSTKWYPFGSGEETNRCRLDNVIPGEIKIPIERLQIIDSLATDGIRQEAYPGCQILAAKNGHVFYSKSFGYQEYNDSIAVTNDDLYDLASVTKVAATTLAIMKLYDLGKLKPEDSLGRYLPELKGSNKSSLRIGDVMAHQAGLQDWIPFYRETLLQGDPDPQWYRQTPEPGFQIRVCSALFLRDDYRDSLISKIINSPLRVDRQYKYSDLGFYLLRFVVEKISGKSFTDFLDTEFYRPLGIHTLTFNPVGEFPLNQLIPTENDQDFRKELIRGYVHDPGAAMLGGISGHAGLFGNTRSLAIILQMLLNKGQYGNRQYLKTSTVERFTEVWSPSTGNRRGLGFDKPPLTSDPNGPVCQSASPQSFGHSGFTGTYIWADPANEMIYIFLSNRIYPDANNQKLSMLNVRTNIHQAFYDLFQNTKVK
jgi:beta-glucosidase-like glycosyl hydrolase/CubicO group peptidase (beta-lactamase class C family)